MQLTPSPSSSPFKLAVLAPEKSILEQLHGLLPADASLEVSTHVGGATFATRIADHEQPDIMIVAGDRHDGGELRALEQITARHPATAVMLISANHSTEFLRDAMRIGLREVLPHPVSREALLDAIGRVRQRAAGLPARRRRGKLVAFIGCKGGSGVTFLAGNLAYALAETEGKKVALIDLNLQFGDAALYLTQRRAKCSVADVAREVHRLDGALLASSMVQVTPTLHVLPAPEAPEQAAQVTPDSIAPLLQVAIAEYDLVVVDAGRTLEPVTLRALDLADLVYAVLELDVPSLHDAKRLLHALAGLGYGKDKLRLLVNRYEKGGRVTLEDAAAALRWQVAHTLPNSFRTVAASINEGVPIQQLAARDPVANGLRDIARSLVGAPKQESSRGWLRAVLSGT
jgi:pilus assembly protein CpaE